MTKHQDRLYYLTGGMSGYLYEPTQPFHADRNLQKFVDAQMEKFNFNSFCETGTFRGDTLRWMAEKNGETVCYSIERSLYYHLLARIRLRNLRNVVLWKGDSAELLDKRIDWMAQPVLFWLDAHWGGDELPLERELNIIKGFNPKALVLIDDVSSKYGDKTITLDMIKVAGFPQAEMFNRTVAVFWLNL